MDEQFKTVFGQALRAQRKACGLTQEQLSLMVNVNRLTLRRIESGTANPTLNVLLKLSDGLGTSFPKLVEKAVELSASEGAASEAIVHASVTLPGATGKKSKKSARSPNRAKDKDGSA